MSQADSGHRVYLDVCALERPFDDQRYLRIRIEAAAVELIVGHVRTGRYVLCRSPVHEEEIRCTPQKLLRHDLLLLLDTSATDVRRLVRSPVGLEQRGRELMGAGLGVADAFHLAYAEQVDADFVTCDDVLLRRCRRCAPRVWCGSPVDFCAKEGLT